MIRHPGIFHAKTTHLDGHVVVALTGELDLATRSTFDAEVAPHLDRDGDVVLDLAELTFMDSTGLHAFIDVQRGIGPRRRLVLRHVPERARSLLELTGMADEFTIEP